MEGAYLRSEPLVVYLEKRSSEWIFNCLSEVSAGADMMEEWNT